MPAFNGFWPRWRQVVGTAANRGALCFGPVPGAQRHLHQPAPRAPPASAPPRGLTPPLAELARRYLRAYGPATPQHFAQWLGNAPRAGD